MKRVQNGGLVLLLVMGVSSALGQEKLDKQPDDFWMKKKLEFSQAVLQGITMEDFDLVRQAATSMRRLSAIESFARRKDTKAYRAQLAIFEHANDDLIAQAEAKDVDAATAAFTQLTLSCVHCHKQLRAANK